MSWDQKTIRRTFLDYFKDHATLHHQEVGGSPIIPRDDPTLLFTNAGMNQFKATLLGEEVRSYTRAVSAQMCIRAGGKHNDLDAVGKDARHLTLFEMLGNWSFGDYYKRAAIEMSWDVSTNVFGLDKSKLYVSVYKDDEESVAIWRDEIGVDPKRIYRFGDVENGDEENFWSMGDTGPCGPCTELFYDLGPEVGTGPEDYMGGEGDRYMEFWNNVFMESLRAPDGSVKPLRMQSVDTGLGLERLAMILQGKLSVYETDVFQPIIQDTIARSGADWTNASQRIDLQVIADHLRSLTFTLSEGGQFSNEGRGYVLRRILRRAVRHGRRLGFEQPFLHTLAPVVAAQFEGVHTVPADILSNTMVALEAEEARFFRTIDRGMGRIHAIMQARVADDGAREINGEEAFELYDTYGFPVDLTQIEASEQGFTVDEPGFNAALEAARERSRQGAKAVDDGSGWHTLSTGGGDGFAGYGLESLDTDVMRWRTSDDGRVEFVLRQTPLYAESGGETADHGRLVGPGFEVKIDDVQKITGTVHHYGVVTKGAVHLEHGQPVHVYVDTARRAAKTIHHTATHLLHAALKDIVGGHVQQKGSVVEADRLRFDYSHGAPLTADELGALERWVNTRVRTNEAVQITEGVPIDDARAQGVVALFGEKYGDNVRTVRAGSDSFELCGGNHVQRTGDIGHLRITSESGVAAGVRRIEAVVGHAADALVDGQRSALEEVAATLKADVARVPERVAALQDEVRALKKALEKARQSGGAVDPDQLIADAIDLDGVPLIAAVVEVDARETLAALVDRLRDKQPGSVVVLGAELDGQAAIIAAVGPRLRGDKRFHAGNIVKALTGLVDGRGGGRPDFAQGGGKAPEKLADAMGQVEAIIRG